MAKAQLCKDPTLFHVNKCNGRVSAWVRKPIGKSCPGMPRPYKRGAERHYIGCFTTFHMAARAQDRASLYLNINAPVNFRKADYVDDAPLRKSMDEDQFLKMLRNESRPVNNTVEKSKCFTKLQKLEDKMEELRGLTQFNIRQFVNHLKIYPTPSPDINEAARTLLEIFGTHSAGTDAVARPVVAEVAHGSVDMVDVPVRVYIPKAKRSTRTSRKAPEVAAADAAADAAGRFSGTRAGSKRRLAMTPSQCPFRRPRS